MKFLLTNLIVIIMTGVGFAQQPKQKIVFDVTSTDTKVHKSTMLMIGVMSKDYPEMVLEVMVYGEALPMLMKNQSTVSSEVAKYSDNNNVKFTACEVSMNLLFNIDKSGLLNGVGTVANAVPDILIKQNNGWGYIKVSN